MAYDNSLIVGKLRRWEHVLGRYRLPDWDEIPDFGLYMEQVVQLLTQYLSFLPPDLKQPQPVTAAVINNYVRTKLLPEPKKKRYYRIHLAYLLMICTLKQSLRLSMLPVLLPGDLPEADVQRIFAVIAGRFPAATVFTETMNPMVVKRFKEKSIEGSKAKFTWGVKDGRALAALLPGFRLAGEHCLTEGMAAFVPVYRLLDKLPLIRNISNRIAILQGTGEEEQPECGGAKA